MSFAIHKQLYTYCHNLLNIELCKGTLDASKAIYEMQHKYPMLYRYPSSYETIIRQSKSDEKTLKALGWLEPIFNQNFIIWYKVNGTVQLVPVNLKTHQMEKHKSLSTEIPFAFKYAKTHEKPGAKLSVVQSPVDATILQDAGLLAIATGGEFLHESHVRHLATLLEFDLVFIALNKNISAADAFCKRLGAIGRESSVVLIDDWDELFTSDDPEYYIDEHKIRSERFIFNRIVEKRRKLEGLSVDEELITAGQMLAPNMRCIFTQFATTKGHDINKKVQYSAALQFMSDLLAVDINVEEAAKTVFKRYGVKINVTSA